MAKLLVVTLALLLTLMPLVPPAHAGGPGPFPRTFRALLTGDQEVPPVDTQTTGRADIQINREQTEGEFTLRVDDGVRVTQSHLHCAVAGVNGPIVVFLAGNHPAGLNVDGKWVDNARFTDQSIVNTSCGTTVAELAQAMREGRVYVNVHTVAHPPGEVRGQLAPPGH
jgi:hypothetical protein